MCLTRLLIRLNVTVYLVVDLQLYNQISSRAFSSHHLVTCNAVTRYREATDAIRDLPSPVRDGADVNELRDLLSNPFLKVIDFYYCTSVLYSSQ